MVSQTEERENAPCRFFAAKAIYWICHRIVASHELHESVIKIIITPETGIIAFVGQFSRISFGSSKLSLAQSEAYT